MTMNTTEVLSCMRANRLIDFCSLLAGWEQGWVDAKAVSLYAIDKLNEGANDPEWLIDLANAEHIDRERVYSLLNTACAGAPNALEHGVERWKLGTLLVIRDKSVSDEEKVDLLDEAYAVYGYPNDLRLLCKYGPSQEAIRNSYATEDDLFADPLMEMKRLIQLYEAALDKK